MLKIINMPLNSIIATNQYNNKRMLNNYQQQIYSPQNMAQQHKCLFDFESIKNIISLYQTFFVKQNLAIELQSIREKGDSFLQYINDELAQRDGKINQITKKSIQIFKVLTKQQYEIHSKILQLQHSIQDKNNSIQNLKYTAKVLEQKVIDRQRQIEKLKNQMLYIQQKFIQQQKQFKRQNKEIKKTFRQVQQTNVQQKQIFDSIQFQYQNLKSQMQRLQEQKRKVEQQLNSFKSRQQQIFKLIQNSKSTIEREAKKRIPLQEEIQRHRLTIEKLKKQIDDLKTTLKNPYERIERINFDDKEYEEYLLYPKQKNSVVTLSEQIPNKEVYDISSDNFDSFYRRQNSMRRSFDQISVGQGRQSFLERAKDSFLQRGRDSFVQKDSQKLMPTADKQGVEQSNQKNQNIQEDNNLNTGNIFKAKKLFMPDPYFAHYILTSQSVKIKEDCEQMLNIDIKPYYKQIVQKRVPMHLWDQWIRNKLIQLAKKRQVFEQ